MPKFHACHVNKARREALAADVVVINHHLFFADLAVRESGMAELLPTVRVAIFDEAHQLNETGVQFLGAQITTGQLLDFGRDMLAAGLQFARGLADWSSAGVGHRARGARPAAGGRPRRARAPSCAGPATRRSRFRRSRGWTPWSAAAGFPGRHGRPGDGERDGARFRSAARARKPAGAARGDASPSPAPPARCAGSTSATSCGWWRSPLDIAQAVQDKLLKQGSADAEQSRKAWIFTSATLGDDAKLRWFTEPCGLGRREVLRVGSPFDYVAQAAVYVPRDLPKPNDPAHSIEVAKLAADAVRRLGGRTMVLTTTLRALRSIGEALQAALRGLAGKLEVLVQGQWPKRRLIERFREGDSQGRPGCVLVASASFWEGVDVPGDSLQLVIIDKLPFPPPGDPLVEARAQRLEGAGPQFVQRLFRAGGGGGAEAGRGAPDPPRVRPGLAGGVRHAAGDDGLWTPAAGGAAADAPASVSGGVQRGAGGVGRDHPMLD